MKKVNIVFDGIFDDADIVAIPDEIFSHIEEIGQAFLHWVPTAEEPCYRKLINGRNYYIAETDGFIKWINTTYCKEFEKCYVVARNTDFDPALKIIEF